MAVSNATSLPEVVGDAGIYFDPFSVEEIRDAIRRLLDDAELRQALIQKGLDRIKEFSWKEAAGKVVGEYK